MLQSRLTSALERGKSKWFCRFGELATTHRPDPWWLQRGEDRESYTAATEELKVRTDETEEGLGIFLLLKGFAANKRRNP